MTVQGKADPDNIAAHKWKLVPEYLKVKGLVKQHLDSFNYFIRTELKEIVQANNRVDSDIDPSFYLAYTDIYVGNPCIEENMVSHPINPQECRLREITYAAPVMVDIQYVRGRQLVVRKGVQIGRMPIMLKSGPCLLTSGRPPTDQAAGKDQRKHSHEAALHAYFAKMGECPLDPGGYFVIRGTEKVILVQEQLSKNRIIVDLDRRGMPIASVTSSTHERKSKTYVALDKKNQLVLRHNSLHEDLPLVLILRAMAISSERDVLLLIAGTDAKLLQAIAPSMEAFVTMDVFTPSQALEYVASKIKGASKGFFANSGFTPRKLPSEEARELLADVIVAHVPATPLDMFNKAVYLCLMARRLLQTHLGITELDDRDYVGNKRLELAGQLLALLFEDCFKRFNGELKRSIDRVLSRQNRAQEFDAFPLLKLQTSIITLGIERAIATGNWNVRRFKMERAGITQVLSRLSYIAALGMMTRITSQFEKTRKVSGPRSLQPSQWGVICPSDTPEGEACGLVKNLALMTHVTTDMPNGEKRLASLLYSLGVQQVDGTFPLDLLHQGDAMQCHVNGIFLGVIQGANHASQLVNAVKSLRRKGLVDPFVSVALNEAHRAIYISSDSGRICRPLLTCNAHTGLPLITKDHIDRVERGSLTFDNLLAMGLVEYLDVNEENDALVAVKLEHCSPGLGNQDQPNVGNAHHQVTTHLEIDPMTVLGAVAGLIPFPHHNQSPRNTYQCAMGKQAIGAIGYNQLERFDSLLYLLVYPQRPLVTTKAIEMIGYDRLPAGHNAIVAVMSFSGYDIEDALVLNKASLDRGFGRALVMRKYTAILKKYSDGRFDRVIPAVPDPATGQINQRFELLDSDGIAPPGERLLNGQIYVNKQMPGPPSTSGSQLTDSATQSFKPAPMSYKGPLPSYIDKVMLSTNNEDQLLVKTLIRQTRRPELGGQVFLPPRAKGRVWPHCSGRGHAILHRHWDHL